ncbi:MAG: PaaI family thioesterase [Sedimentitalea sp.]
MTPEQAQKLYSDNFAPWVQALDLTVTEISAEAALVRMPLGDHLSRVGGIVSGQALAALADTSMVLAAIAHIDTFKPLATTDLHTQFLRPGVGTAIISRAYVVRAGRALIFARADMREEESNKMVATSSATFFLP